MSNEQKLREALRIAVNYIDMDALYTFAGGDHDTIKEALATTEPEPEPTGMPELPEADVSFEDGKDQYGYPEYDHAFSLELIKTYGEQCWKAGYKHGAWGGKPAVNQQLTTEPVDEREAFEKWVTKNGEWPNNALRSRLDPDRYVDIQGLWEAWQARAAMAQVSDINVVESFTNDTKDAERYRWLRDDTDSDWAICEWSHDPGDEGYYRDARAPHIVDAAIDAAMTQGVKG